MVGIAEKRGSSKATEVGRKVQPPSFWSLAHTLSELSEQQRILTIRNGMSVEWLLAMKSAFSMTRESVAHFVNLSESTLDRHVKRRLALDPSASERLDRIAQVAVLAEEVFEDKKIAQDWMATASELLGGQTPLSLCDTELGARQVRRVLHSIEWGGVA